MPGVIRKLFPKKNETDSKITAQARIKSLTYQLNLKIKEYDKKSQLCKMKAKQYLKRGNRTAAKNMLARSKRFDQKLSQYSAMIIKAERHLDALDEAETLKTVSTAMAASATELKISSQEINVDRIMQIEEDAESAIDLIEESSEIFSGDPELDMGLDMDEELDQLEAELMLEDAGSLPDASNTIHDDLISMSLEDDDAQVSSKDKLKDEISKLKEDLDL